MRPITLQNSGKADESVSFTLSQLSALQLINLIRLIQKIHPMRNRNDRQALRQPDALHNDFAHLCPGCRKTFPPTLL